MSHAADDGASEGECYHFYFCLHSNAWFFGGFSFDMESPTHPATLSTHEAGFYWVGANICRYQNRFGSACRNTKCGWKFTWATRVPGIVLHILIICPATKYSTLTCAPNCRRLAILCNQQVGRITRHSSDFPQSVFGEPRTNRFL